MSLDRPQTLDDLVIGGGPVHPEHALDFVCREPARSRRGRRRRRFRLFKRLKDLGASVIRNVVGQVVTRFSMSVSSVASAVLMVQPPPQHRK